MSARPRPGLARTAKLFGLALLAAAAAGGIGTGAASLTRESTTATAPAAGAPDPATSVDIEVVAAVLHPAASASGKLRKRARQSVELRVTNRATSAVTLERPSLQSDGRTARADLNARDEARGLLGPIAGGASIRGVLRFETAGALSDSLKDAKRATLRYAGRELSLRVKVGGPAAS